MRDPTIMIRPRDIAAALADIKLAHTVFALPFALLAAFLVRPKRLPEMSETERYTTSVLSSDIYNLPWETDTVWSVFIPQLGLIVLCMFFARTWAMLINRLADAKFDKQNPRTASRAIPSGTISPHAVRTLALITAGAFWVCAALFYLLFGNYWPAILAPLALLWTGLYAYTKRFTALCHFFLGTALAISPICAAVAIEPWLIGANELLRTLDGRALLALAGFITCWVAGFDIPYALADIDVDKKLGLHSIPAKLGVNGALWASRVLHLAAAVCLFVFAALERSLGAITFVAASLVAALLIYEHLVLARRGVAGLPIAFFTVNGVISLLFSAAAIADTLLN